MTVKEMTKARLRLGMTQRKLSKLLKKNQTFVCKLENGKRKFPLELQMQVKQTFRKVRASLR